MKRFYILGILLFASQRVRADQLDGLAGLEIIAVSLITTVFSLLTLIVCSIKRFNGKSNKANLGIDISSLVIIGCSLVSIATLSGSIDPGFLATCIGLIALAISCVLLNHLVGRNNRT